MEQVSDTIDSELTAPLVKRDEPPASWRKEGSLALDAFPIARADGPSDAGWVAPSSFKIPRWVVWSVLTLALVASGLFLVGQLSPMWGLGASVKLQFTESSGRETISKSYAPFKMSLFFSIKACIKTGLVAEVIMGLILVLFSGIWPHVKILMMLFCWFKPKLNHRLRHIILYWVDTWGKFSFADPLIVVALMVVFSVGVNLSAGDLLFQQIGNVILKAEGLDDTLTLDDVQSINIKVDIVAIYGIYFFCLGVWLSLILGAVVEHYNVRLLLLVTHDDVLLSEDSSIENTEDGSSDKNESGATALKFRSRTKWLAALVALPILPILIVTYVVPLFERTIDGVLPMLVSVFGWIHVLDPPSKIVQPLTYGQIFRFLGTQEGSGIWIMITTVILCALAVPTFRSVAFNLMWYLPSSASLSDHGISKAEYRRKADVLLSASNVSSNFDTLAVWLFAMILVHFEIGAISEQINMPFCYYVAVGAQMLESFCPKLKAMGGFLDDPKYEFALKMFSKKHPGWDGNLPNFGARCDNIISIAEGFNMESCIDIGVMFQAGMWFVMAAVVLTYFSSLLLTYPWSIEVFGRDSFEAPVCYQPQGWFCCCCCVGQTGNRKSSNENDVALEHFEYSCKKSLRGWCWCCHKNQRINSE